MSYTLHFAQFPSTATLDGEAINPTDAVFPREIDADAPSNPYNVRLWVIGHQFGAVCAVWASHEQDALDRAVDTNRMDFCLAETQDYDDEALTALGNASELFDLSEVWIAPVVWDAARDIHLIVAMVRAHESGADTL